jgi:nucleotide-binding universal stress UspA family protein
MNHESSYRSGWWRAHSKAAIAFKAIKRVGNFAQEILAQTNESAVDPIVMGAHGHGSIQSLVLGSVTQKVLVHSVIPVLVVR